jgi:GDP-L-fucose synthase
MELKDKTVLVTGGAGFLGSFVVEELKKKAPKKIIIPRSKEQDLRKYENCLQVTKNVDVVIHLAAHVGGIGLNQKLPGTLFYNNAIMGIQLIEACRINNVKKVVVAGTICAYPKFTPVPFKEEDLWNGYPEETNAPYGEAKRALLVQLQAYRKEFGLNGIFLLPVNLYGPKDNFNPDSSHVIPALIRKFYEAKKNNQNEVVVWGDGSASREFLYVQDAAEGIILATEKYDEPDPINLGNGREIKISELVNMIAQMMKFQGKIVYDTSKPNGQPRRCLNVEKAKQKFGFIAKTSFEDGLKRTIDWFISHQS